MRFLGNKELLVRLTEKAQALEVNERKNLATFVHYRYTKALSGGVLLSLLLREGLNPHLFVCGFLTALYFFVMNKLRTRAHRAARKEIKQATPIEKEPTPWSHLALEYEDGNTQEALLFAQILLFQEELPLHEKERKVRLQAKTLLLEQTHGRLEWTINNTQITSRDELVKIAEQCRASLKFVKQKGDELEKITRRCRQSLEKLRVLLIGQKAFEHIDTEGFPVPVELTLEWIASALESAVDDYKKALLEWDCSTESIPPLRTENSELVPS